MILIVKEDMYGMDFKRMLCRLYRFVGHWRFQPPYYSGPDLNYNQTVLFAVKDPTADAKVLASRLDSFPEPKLDLPAVASEPVYKTPPGRRPPLFQAVHYSKEAMRSLISRSRLSYNMNTISPVGCGRPPLPLKQGHIALTLASGVINGAYGRVDDGSLHVIRGTVVRHEDTQYEVDSNALGNKSYVVEKVTDSFVIKLRAMTPDGLLHEMLGGDPETQKGSK